MYLTKVDTGVVVIYLRNIKVGLVKVDGVPITALMVNQELDLIKGDKVSFTLERKENGYVASKVSLPVP